MSVASILSGTPAGLASIGTLSATAISGETLTVSAAEGVFIDHGLTTANGGVFISNGDSSGTVRLNLNSEGRAFVQWLNLDAPGSPPPRYTYEDWGYAPGQPARRYTQYSESVDCSGDDGGAVLLNWGPLDDTRVGLITGGEQVILCPSITAADVVQFSPRTITPAILAATGIAAPTYTIQPGVSFSLTVAMPVGEAWNYIVYRGGGPQA